MPAVSTTPVAGAAQKLFKRLRREAGRAIQDYQMIRAGDRVMVCLSGGKDSFAMAELLLALKRSAPVGFELVAVNLDQYQPGFPREVIPAWCAQRDLPFEQLSQDTYAVVRRVIPDGATMCGLCSRLRRGHLYRHAAERGYTKLALGHHLDDIVATFFLNLFHGGRLAAMPPKLRSEDGRNTVIRPLAYCRERDLAAYAALSGFPVIPCTLCGSQPNLQRAAIGRMLDAWERESPGRVRQIFKALANVQPSQLADRDLFDFAALDGGAPARWLPGGAA
ncbi:MAG: tRNA 2-thiocytidine(32) synthetase TtcA [Gammaproteobacteria bacterium]|nr:tRNA 2-thiocytidine(32) synthetase TtcA [Gammaproteobacteria bacterium]